jgi:hypothetical protein
MYGHSGHSVGIIVFSPSVGVSTLCAQGGHSIGPVTGAFESNICGTKYPTPAPAKNTIANTTAPMQILKQVRMPLDFIVTPNSINR